MFGSTKADEEMEEVIEKRLSRSEAATVQGLMNEMQVVKQQMEHLHERLRHLIGLYGTLQNQFNTFNQQRIAELQLKVNGGPTDHGYDRPSTEAGDDSAE